MINYFTYSVLEYKHNLTLGESLNVGILFFFSEDNTLEFVYSDSYRPKAIYPDFSNSLFNTYLKSINVKIKKDIDLFYEKPNDDELSNFIHKNILSEDAAGLSFRNPVHIKSSFFNKKEVVDEFSKLLLPGVNIEKPKIEKHNENYIIKKFNGYLFSKDNSIESKFTKNQLVHTKHFKIKFDLSCQNDKVHNYIKPINFDFTDESSIQTKAAVFYSYISDLNSYSNSKTPSFDFLITKPTDIALIRSYENAIDLLSIAKAQKKLILEDDLEQYSNDLISQLGY